MIRNISAIIAGFLTASVLMLVCEYSNHLLFPFPTDMDTTDLDQVRAFAAQMPIQSLILVLIGWVTGSIASGWVTTSVAKTRSITPALITGALLTIAGILNAWMIWNPVWFHFGMLPVFLIGTYIGYRITKKHI
jgi:hypothetical protein